MPALADDEVVMHLDAERFCRLDDLLRHLDIGAGRRRVAGGVIVDQDQRRGIEFEGAFHHFARIDGCVVDRAFLLHFVRDQMVLAVEKQDAELFGRIVRHRSGAIFEQRRP